MPKKAAGLTAKQAEKLTTPGLFADGNGLYLQVTASGAKTWIFRYQIAGRRRDMGLGGFDPTAGSDGSLAKARERAWAAKELVKQGIDPLVERDRREAAVAVAAAQAAQRAYTFQQCAEAYITAKRPGWKNEKHAAQWTSTLTTYAYPIIGKTPVADVNTEHVLQVLTPIWTAKPETASRVRGRIEAVLDYAKTLGRRTGENPARWKGHLALTLPAKTAVRDVKHHEALPYTAMLEFWPRLQIHDGLGARALELAILTATRTGEVLGARWSEIDLDGAVWTIPAQRMKAGVDHRVPLSAPAIALLRKLATLRRGDTVFPGASTGGQLSNMSMLMVLRRMNENVTPHGFRSTFRTWTAEMTSYPDAVAEAALAHTLDDKVVAAYQRGDLFQKRRDLMNAWAEYVTTGGRVASLHLVAG
jgi:integrase